MFRELGRKIGMIWCRLAHESLMWPVHGQYECRRCGRHYPAFAEAPITNQAVKAAPSGASRLPASAPAAEAWLSRA